MKPNHMRRQHIRGSLDLQIAMNQKGTHWMKTNNWNHLRANCDNEDMDTDENCREPRRMICNISCNKHLHIHPPNATDRKWHMPSSCRHRQGEIGGSEGKHTRRQQREIGHTTHTYFASESWSTTNTGICEQNPAQKHLPCACNIMEGCSGAALNLVLPRSAAKATTTRQLDQERTVGHIHNGWRKRLTKNTWHNTQAYPELPRTPPDTTTHMLSAAAHALACAAKALTSKERLIIASTNAMTKN